jgi:NAD(P)-dependent dehydrogenase (short-subunit alcohol dehydrogenase family)
MSARLAGRRIAITGAASGIGLETARVCARHGARVALLDIDAGAAQAAAATIPGSIAIATDVTQEASVEAAFASAVKTFGGLDGLVVSAGIDLMAPVEAMTLAQWQRLMDVNLTGAFLACRAAMPALKASGKASGVLISSGAGLRPLARRTAYCASKAGLVMLAKTLAIEAAPAVRFNAVCPGAVDTPLFRWSVGQGEVTQSMEAVKQRYVLERIAEPIEIANAILFLLGDESSYITGSALAVDAGRSFH